MQNLQFHSNGRNGRKERTDSTKEEHTIRKILNPGVPFGAHGVMM
jgi:hypothetical protein